MTTAITAYLALPRWPCRRCGALLTGFVRRRYLGVCCASRIFAETLDEYIAQGYTASNG